MKKIYKNEYGKWQEATKKETGAIEVPDEVIPEFMNTPYYMFDEYSADNYKTAYSLFEIQQAKNYLVETDYISIQWRDEEKLKTPHKKTETEYLAILKKRQDARDKIRDLEKSVSKTVL